MTDFDNFKWLLRQKPVVERRFPDNKNLVSDNGYILDIKGEEFCIVREFGQKYLHLLDMKCVLEQVDMLKDPVAKLWALFAIKYAYVVEPDNEKWNNEIFKIKLSKIANRVGVSENYVFDIFKSYLPIKKENDCFLFAYDMFDSPLYSYFYVLLICLYKSKYPVDANKCYPANYYQCKTVKECVYAAKCRVWCRMGKGCFLFEKNCGKNYDYDEEIIKFQREITLSFLKYAPKKQKSKALVKLFETFDQINKSGIFDGKLSLSYDNVLYGGRWPHTGSLYLGWDNVKFHNGFYLVSHPDLSFAILPPYRVNDCNSRQIFNGINELFMKTLPPLCVEVRGGRITNILNRTDLSACITLMEHSVVASETSKKKKKLLNKFERREMNANDAKKICKEYKSRYLDYLCAKQLSSHKVVCCVEHRVNSEGGVTNEYSFIFTIKETRELLYLAYENSCESRCTYLFPIRKTCWEQSVDKLYEYFASIKINKRQSLASYQVNLKMPGKYEYHRVLHKNYLSWVDRIKNCDYM